MYHKNLKIYSPYNPWIFIILILQCIRKTGIKVCWKTEFQEAQNCREICNLGSFDLPNMTRCHPWLTCTDIWNDIQVKHLLAQGAVKKAHLAEWKGYYIVYSKLANPAYFEDFRHHITMLKAFALNPRVIQLLGFCDDVVVTEYYKLSDARHFHEIFMKETGKLAPVDKRFSMCIGYVEILAFLHNSPVGTRVMCDSNSLEKTLSQFLIRDDMSLILNDLDALPEVSRQDERGIKCGHRQLYGDFVAPEQKWPYQDRDFNDSDMPFYDEKSDIWKIPDVCSWFLGGGDTSEIVRFHLHRLHRQCKNTSPHLRPTSIEVLQKYRYTWKTLFDNESK